MARRNLISLGEKEEVENEQRDIKMKRNYPSDFLPSNLRPFVQHSHGDFWCSPYFDPALVAQLMCEGFLPISNHRYLIPKLHKKRCVVFPLQTKTNESIPESHVHTSKSTRKKAKKFHITLNKDFDAVVRGCHAQHGVAWLYPQIVEAFRVIHEKTKTEPYLGINTNIVEIQSDGKLNLSATCAVRLYSVELWNINTGKLAAGELGYSVGTIFTSLTGFSAEDSAGSVQLAALGSLLSRYSFDMWDLGMELEYKSRLGAHNMERDKFVDKVKTLRVKNIGGVLKCDERISCKDILTDDYKL